MAGNRPRSREKNVTGGSKGVKRRGSGLGNGPVGGSSSSAGGSSVGGGSFHSSSSMSGGTYGSSGSGRRVTRAGGKSPLTLIIIIAVLLLGGGGSLTSLLPLLLGGGGSSYSEQSVVENLVGNTIGNNSNSSSTNTGNSSGTGDILSSFSSLLNSGSTSSGWELGANTGKLNTTVDSEARDKRTQIKGKGKDEVTIMVYMCGTDLESRSGMGTSDLQEMLNADLGNKVNLIVYTGGCKGWKNNVVSSSVNQIYQIKNGKMQLLKEEKAVSMTDPNTLTGFIKWCTKNYPANRNQLIFWDHGGGSISGFGYDEKFKSSGSMNLAEINQALKKADVTFDFVGFDACLMATLENALMLTPYADYMIASEETEPGVGWYYTDWLTALGKNTSMSTIDIGKNIVDDFVDTCASKCRGQKTTLSVVDLAELEATVPEEFKAFSKSASELIQDKKYQAVSDARYNTREFAASNAIDQVDLVHLAQNMGTEEGEDLAEALLGAVKYNRTSSNMTNAYGLSIYFPYKKVSTVDQAVDTYEAIGMDEEYMRCIQEFASLEVGGQTATGGTSSPIPSLMGTLLGGGSSSGGSSDMIAEMLGGFLSGQFGNIAGLDRSNTGFVEESGMDTEVMAEYLAENYFDASALVWSKNDQGKNVLELSEKQWSLVHSLELNMFYDDGEGYVDLGYDNVFEFDEKGRLIGDTDRTWLAINGQPVAYYYEDTVDDGENYTITGRVPVLLNGERANLILVFDNENPYGYIAGARTDYVEGETETVAKGMEELQVGDKLDFICDYYSYAGEYLDSYFLGEQMNVTADMLISNVDVGEGDVKVTYRFTDIYNQQYWTPAFTQ
ncbi:MAG: peptidase C11 [Lachnospiraceae bacterium]|nr:peptidase C11 [Lachnospiraceae bacterium]